jgi:peptidoglycan-associated lipoprotein
MTLKQWAKILLVGASILTLAACSSARRPGSDGAVTDENAAYSDAQSSGAGDDSNFNDGNGSRKLAAGKVYYFDFNSNQVRDSDMPAISANAKKLAAQPGMNVLMEGHTDPRGSREYNIGLGERRAKAVAEVLTQKGVEPSQIRVVSYGAEKLASAGHTDADYQQDRRAVLVYVQR